MKFSQSTNPKLALKTIYYLAITGTFELGLKHKISKNFSPRSLETGKKCLTGVYGYFSSKKTVTFKVKNSAIKQLFKTHFRSHLDWTNRIFWKNIGSSGVIGSKDNCFAEYSRSMKLLCRKARSFRIKWWQMKQKLYGKANGMIILIPLLILQSGANSKSVRKLFYDRCCDAIYLLYLLRIKTPTANAIPWSDFAIIPFLSSQKRFILRKH